jgi:hypothetical protein
MSTVMLVRPWPAPPWEASIVTMAAWRDAARVVGRRRREASAVAAKIDFIVVVL